MAIAFQPFVYTKTGKIYIKYILIYSVLSCVKWLYLARRAVYRGMLRNVKQPPVYTGYIFFEVGVRHVISSIFSLTF